MDHPALFQSHAGRRDDPQEFYEGTPVGTLAARWRRGKSSRESQPVGRQMSLHAKVADATPQELAIGK